MWTFVQLIDQQAISNEYREIHSVKEKSRSQQIGYIDRAYAGEQPPLEGIVFIPFSGSRLLRCWLF